MNLIEALSVFGITTLSAESHMSLKRRYRGLAKDKHPDRTGGGSDEFIALQEAYVILKKEVKDTGEDFVPAASTEEVIQSGPVPKARGYVVVEQADIDKMKSEQDHVVSDSKELKTLSKDELLEKYYNDTQDLQQKIGSLVNNYELHRNILGVVEDEVSQLSEDYRQQMNQLQSHYQKQIERLEKNALYRFWVRYLVSPLTGKDIWTQYRENVDTYEKERQKVKSSYNEKLLGIYGQSLNEMNKYLTTSE